MSPGITKRKKKNLTEVGGKGMHNWSEHRTLCLGWQYCKCPTNPPNTSGQVPLTLYKQKLLLGGGVAGDGLVTKRLIP